MCTRRKNFAFFRYIPKSATLYAIFARGASDPSRSQKTLNRSSDGSAIQESIEMHTIVRRASDRLAASYCDGCMWLSTKVTYSSVVGGLAITY